MESRRKQKWDDGRQEAPRRQSQYKPPRCQWQPAMPLWEKEFCRVVGSLDWETLLQMKKFIHLYDNVMNWNDSAGKEAFCDAKKRFWAEINGFPCDITLPGPDLYIDEINWDLESDPELLSDDERQATIPNTEENNETVVIFGDSLISRQEFSPVGWGDDEVDVKAPANSVSANNRDSWEYNNSSNSVSDGNVATAWPGFCNNAWPSSNEGRHTGYSPWAGGWDNHANYAAKHQTSTDNKAHGQGNWGYRNSPRLNAGRYVSNHRNFRPRKNDNYVNQPPKSDRRRHKATNMADQSTIDRKPSARKWESFNSQVLVGGQPERFVDGQT